MYKGVGSVNFCAVFVTLEQSGADEDEELGWAWTENGLEFHAREFVLYLSGLHRKPSKVLSIEGA